MRKKRVWVMLGKKHFVSVFALVLVLSLAACAHVQSQGKVTPKVVTPTPPPMSVLDSVYTSTDGYYMNHEGKGFIVYYAYLPTNQQVEKLSLIHI